MPDPLLNPRYFWPPHPGSQLAVSFGGQDPAAGSWWQFSSSDRGARRDPQGELSSWLLLMCIPPPKALGSSAVCRGAELKSLCTSLCSEPAPHPGMKPGRLCLCSGREITLLRSKIHVFIHNSLLFPCSWDTGDDTHRPKTPTGACGAGSTRALLMGGQAKSLGQGVTTGQGPADLGHRYLGRRYLGQEGLNLLARSGARGHAWGSAGKTAGSCC